MAQDNENATIVLVDDEEMVLTSLKSFLSLETDYDIARFHGQADYWCFDEDWDEIGWFALDLSRLVEGEEYSVEYSIRCEGMERRVGNLLLKSSDNAARSP